MTEVTSTQAPLEVKESRDFPPVPLPCGCSVEPHPEHVSGDRGVRCPTHEKAYVLTARPPRGVEHVVTKEIPYASH